MFDVDVFLEIIKQENVQFLVNDEFGWVVENTDGVSILDKDKELIEKIKFEDLEKVEISEDNETLIVNQNIKLKVQEFFTVKF